MALIRRVATVFLLFAGLTGTLADARPVEPPLAAGPVADVGWPPSASLLVAEMVTGGASASDEWIELANVAPVPADLGGLELVYASASGATVTRKATWPSGASLAPGARLLLANAAGIHASIADATYSGGLAATGGAVAIRPIGGDPVDAVGWGDAVSAFVEGAAAVAPPAGSSIARLTIVGGGLVDTNDNAADLFVDPAPVPEGLGSGPSPSPSATPSLTPSAEPSPVPSPEPSAEPSAEPSPSPSAAPSAVPSPSPEPNPSMVPSPEPSAAPTPTTTPEPSPSSSPDPTAQPSPEPSPSPSPDITPIGDARALPLGATVTVEGVLTTALGALESGRGAFVQDETGGIALYLDASAQTGLAPGERIRVAGTTTERYGQRTLRAAETAIVILGHGATPLPVTVATGHAGEAFEGRLIGSGGWVVDGPDALADGQAVTIDAGTGPLRVVVAEALIDGPLATGEWLDVVGPLGQRDSSGTGTAGYRVHVTRPGDLVRSSVGPSPSPAPEPSVPPAPSASPSPSPSPEPSPSAGPGHTPILVARGLPVGSVVRVHGVVTAEPGRVEKPPLVPIDDGTAGIIVRLPDGATVTRGRLLEVVGRLADPYGQLEVRVADAAGLVDLGPGLEPLPAAVVGADLGESLEARAVDLAGRLLRADRTTAGTTTADLEDVDGAVFRVMIHPSTGIERTSLVKGATYRLVGIVGQRASRSGALDGYRVWLRDGADLELLAAAPTASPSPAGPPGASPDPGSIRPIAIAAALARAEGPASVEGVVTVPSRLLDATGRRIVLEDASGAVEVLLPAPADPTVGTWLRVSGTLGTAYGAPRMRADAVETVGRSTLPIPATLSGAPTARLEWRLARATGTLVDVERLGDRWRGELRLDNGAIVPLSGLAGAGIDAAGLREGAVATVVGIVRRPYPSATDQRFTLVPRSPSDLRLVPAGPAASAERAGAPATPDGRPASRTPDQANGAPLVDLARLAEHLGRTVRIGGLVVAVAGTTVELDDGTALGRLVLVGTAAAASPDLRPGDALTATGRVEGDPSDPEVVVDDAATIVLAGDPVAAGARDGSAPSPAYGAAVTPAAGLDRSAAASAVEAPLASLALLAVFAVAAAGGLAAVYRRSSSRRRTAILADRLRRVLGPGAAPQAPSVAPARATLAAERGDSA